MKRTIAGIRPAGPLTTSNPPPKVPASKPAGEGNRVRAEFNKEL